MYETLILLVIIIIVFFSSKKSENMNSTLKFEEELPAGYKVCGLRCAGSENIYYGNPNQGFVKIDGLKKNRRYSCKFNDNNKSNAYRSPFLERDGFPISIDIEKIKSEFIDNTGEFDRTGLGCYNKHDIFYTPYSHNYE